MTIVNNVTRMLDAKNISYQAYSLPEEKLSALEAAEWIGVSPDLVYKSIVAVRTSPGKPLLAVVPGDRELDPKLLAKAVGEKKVRVASHKQAETLTDLQTGGISPLALVNKGFQILIDKSATDHEKIFVSGGQRGLNIKIASKDLARLTNARFAPIS